ncbi:MAG: hypothetical protein ABI583_04435 [Betaproteobacteria bacterium]
MQQSLIFAADMGAPTTARTLKGSHLREPEARPLRYLALGLLLSLCFHIIFFVLMPKREVNDDSPSQGGPGPMVVQLTPSSPSPPPAPTVAVVTPPTPQATRPRTVAPLSPRMMTVPSAAPQSIPLEPEPPAPVKHPEAAPTDFMSMVNANRERRAATESAARAQGRSSGRDPSANDIAMANINRNIRSLTQGSGTSGVFQIISKGHRAAQFAFRGWTTDSRDSRREVIDVDAGLNGNVDQAIIRRMIELIRTHYQGDFNWESQRLGRVVVLSARVEDSVGLEEFMMREFFH